MWIRGSPSRSTSERLWAKGKRGKESKGKVKGSKREGSKGKQKGREQKGRKQKGKQRGAKGEEAKGNEAKGREQRAHKRSEVLPETSPRHMPSWTPLGDGLQSPHSPSHDRAFERNLRLIS